MTTADRTELGESRASELVGRTIARYRVDGFVGAGGMGEVYRAHDTKLGRNVAIKILPRALVADLDRLARFEREARILAALNHPNIATIHGVEEADGVRALVLELIAGETLADRLRRRPLPLADALAIARQIADALDAAHEKGIVHRDVKPANVMITESGLVKVLDFGIAAMRLGPSAEPVPEAPADATLAGAIRGTAPYMSPEQARGAPVDKRTDIWAFGCVLFEMLTGRAAFDRDTTSDTLVAILEREPDWSALPTATPPAIMRMLRRCLEKDPRKRLRDIGDVLGDIDDVKSGASNAQSTARRSTNSARWKLATATAIVVAGVATAFAWKLSSRGSPAAAPIRTSVTLPSAVTLDTAAATRSLALSADGRRLAYVGTAAGQKRLYVRSLDEFDAKPIDGTDGARYPVFSPDGKWIAFFTDRQLKRVSIAGGAPIVVCDIPPIGRGATWGPDGYIVFASEVSGLMRVKAEGGEPAPIETLDPEIDGRRHTWPEYLPDGSGLVSTIDLRTLVVLSFATRHWHELLPGSQAQYLDSGYLVYHASETREGQLNAVALDVDKLALRGSPFPVLDGAFRSANAGAAYFAVARSGTLAFALGGHARTLVRVDRQGHRSPLIQERRGFRFPRVSPDGQRIAVTIDPRPSQIWVYDLQRGTGLPLTTRGHNIGPSWSQDGERVAFSSGGIFWAPADGREQPSVLVALTTGVRNISEASWSRDGRTLVFQQQFPDTDYDIWTMRAGESPEPLIASPARELGAKLSPDSRWIAYESNESGRNEVYARPFPNVNEQKWTLSTAGGWNPVWAPDGREVFYMNGPTVMAVPVTADGKALVAGKPEALFDGPFDTSQNNNFDVFPNGREFVMVEKDPDANPTKIDVVQNWSGEVARLAQSATGAP
jgi:serine/threonine-protein kinase